MYCLKRERVVQYYERGKLLTEPSCSHSSARIPCVTVTRVRIECAENEATREEPHCLNTTGSGWNGRDFLCTDREFMYVCLNVMLTDEVNGTHLTLPQ